MTRILKHIFWLLPLTVNIGCTLTKSANKHPETEFRGVWIATVANIDWPKHPSDPLDKKKGDYLRILNFYDSLNFNAVIVQLRTAGDALYPTELAPWSRVLSGKEGQAPETDLLPWMIGQAHDRGMEFHAWMNPYRATTDLDTLKLAPDHDYYRHRDWMIRYGKKYYYDPGLPAVRMHLTDIMREIVEKYPVDGLHFDDYFYPYKIKDTDFPDGNTYKQFAQTGQNMDDWRRSNVDSLIQQVHGAIKGIKPWVRFGISPFGVWRNQTSDPKGSDTQAGQTTYDDLYADPLLWMRKRWIDYIVPQLYWSLDYPVASHKKLVSWWAANAQGTQVYIGNGPYKIRKNPDKAWENKRELPKQIALARETPNIDGNVFFSAKSLMGDNKDVVTLLGKKLYSRPALVPDQNVPGTIVRGATTVEWAPGGAEAPYGKLKIRHWDSLPAYAAVFAINNRKKPEKRKLLGQVYIPALSASSVEFTIPDFGRNAKLFGVMLHNTLAQTTQMEMAARNTKEINKTTN